MAFTQSDIDALKAAIVARNGVKQMSFGDKMYSFESADDMVTLLRLMEQDVAAAANTPRTRYAGYCKGL